MKAWLFAFATLVILWGFWHDLQDREADEEIQHEWPSEYDEPQRPGVLLINTLRSHEETTR